MFNKKVNKIILILRKNSIYGLTITELVKVSKFSRHIVINILTKLDGADQVFIRKAGMAKIYSLKRGGKNEQKD